MAISLEVGQVELVPLTLHSPDGSVFTGSRTFASGNESVVRARVNPADSSQGGLLGIGAGGPTNVTLLGPSGPGGQTRQTSTPVSVSVTAPDLSNAEIGTPSAPSTTIPTWLQS